MIQIQNVSLQFEEKPVIQDLNLSIKKGERIAIIGPSGCGKSTLLRLMIGLYKPNKGHILVDGKDIEAITSFDLKKLRLKFGFLFQSSALFDSMTVEENVAFSLIETLHYPLQKAQKRVKELLALVGMEKTEHLMPSDLSGGMKKRIGLARAIAAEPEILLYDEPTTGLDPIRSTQIEDLIVKLAKQLQVTSIVVTHQHSTILRTADKIYCMKNGQLLPPETPDSILKSENAYIRDFIQGGLQESLLCKH